MGTATVFFETAASSLFLARFGSGWLPYVYVAAAVVNTVAGVGYSALQARTSFRRLMMATVAFLLATTLLLRVGLGLTDGAWLFFLLLVWYRVISILTDLEFWAVAGRLYDVRQAKRLFGIVGSGEVVARIAGAFSVPLLVHAFGVSNLLVLSALGLLACLLLVGAVLRGVPAEAAPAPPTRPDAVALPRPGVLALLEQPFIRVIVALAFFGILAKYLVDYAFLDQMRSRFGEVGALASFFALFSGVSQVLSLLTRVLVSGPLLARFGVRVGLLVLPLAHVVCTALVLFAALVPGEAAAVFWLVVLNQGIYKTLKHPIDNPSFKVLYQPLRKEQRLATQVAVETLVTPLTIGLAGGIMILANQVPAGGAAALAAVMLLVFGGWLVAAVRGGREYAGALLAALRGRIVDDSPFAYDDARSRAVLHEALESDRPGDVLFALELLDRNHRSTLVPSLVRLLDHAAPEVRASALQRLEAAGARSAADAVAPRLHLETEPGVRALAVRCLCGLLGARARTLVAPLLDDRHPDVRRGALVGLLRAGDELAFPRVVEMAGGDTAKERALAARVVGEVALPAFHGPLQWLLEDADPEVKRAALAAAGRVGEPMLFPVVVRCLGDRRVHGAAVAALLAGGAAAVPAVLLALTRGVDARVSRDLARFLGRVGGEPATAALMRCLEAPDARLRTEALLALRACAFAPPPEGREFLRGQAAAEIAWAAWTREAMRSLADAEGRTLLRDALDHESAAARDRVLLILSLLHDPLAVLRARESLAHGTREKRAFALEVLDLTLQEDGELRASVIGLFEEGGGQKTAPRRPDEWVAEVLHQAARVRPWTMATALHAVAHGGGGPQAVEMANALRADQSALVAETAAWATRRAAGSDGAHVAAPRSPGDQAQVGGGRMLTIERVICLKAVHMFAEASEEILADVAAILEELTVEPGDVILEKGAPGDSMYIVVDGRVRVYDGDHVITTLGEREIFGELALLDPEPRFASVAAVARTRLFRLDREAFSELMAGNIEIVRGVLHVLCERLRKQAGQVGSAQDRRVWTGAAPLPGQGA
jgi:ATP:ADP antiporter, AAA family